MHKYYFVTYFLFFVWQYVRWKLKDKLDTIIHFCFFSRVRVYTKKLVKVATFFIWVYPSGFYYITIMQQCSIVSITKKKKTEVSKKGILVDQKMKKSLNKKNYIFFVLRTFWHHFDGGRPGGGSKSSKWSSLGRNLSYFCLCVEFIFILTYINIE